MSFTEQIINHLNSLKYSDFTMPQIMRHLGIYSVYEKKEVTRAVKQLVADGRLIECRKGVFKLVKDGELKRGIVRANKKGFAFISPVDGGEDVFVPHKNLASAMNKDEVYYTILRGDEAKVISIINRGMKRVVGTFKPSRLGGWVVPDDEAFFDDIAVMPRSSAVAKSGDKVIVEITSYKARSTDNIKGRIVEVLGNSSDPHSAVLSCLKSHDFSDCFPLKVIKAARNIPTEIKLGTRQDFRKLMTITIDGDDAKDFDDAISIVKKGKEFTLYVHIADVSNYVTEGSVLDIEALKRGTSVYFPGQVFPMLPAELSEEMCSLKPHEDRYVLTVIMKIDANGVVTNSKIAEGIINSDERMTYRKISAILDKDEELTDEYSHILVMVNVMKQLRDLLYKNRDKRGSVNFDTKEAMIKLDDDGMPIDIKAYPYEVSNSIIEEFMLLANETVARTMCDLNIPFVYRVHDKPTEEKRNTLKLFLSNLGYNYDLQEMTPSTCAMILEDVKGTQYESIINRVMLRSMAKAKYSENNSGHFGLAFTDYCHFTSPIRRYPDLMIHRIIKEYLHGKLTPERIEELKSIVSSVANVTSERERAAEIAEREIDDYYKALYMERFVGESYEGIISGVTNFGVFVELDNTVEGLIMKEDLLGKNFTFDESRYALIGSDESYKLGDKIRISVHSVDVAHSKVRFVHQSVYERDYAQKD